MAYNKDYPPENGNIALTSQYLKEKAEQLRTEQIVDAGFLGGQPASYFMSKGDITNEYIKIIALGDSITAGYPFTDNCPIESIDIYSWTNSIRQNLKVDVINKGIGGQTTTQLLSRFASDVITNKPSHCIIMCGINDAYKTDQGITIQQSLNNFIALITLCTQNNIIPIVGIFIPTTNCTYGTTEINQKCDTIRQNQINYCTNNNIPMIDFYNLFLENISGNIINSLYGSDLLHPNENGYNRMGWLAVKTLKNIIPKFKGQDTSMADTHMFVFNPGEAPKMNYYTGSTWFNSGIKNPGEVAAGICTTEGQPGSWMNIAYAREMLAQAPNKTHIVFGNDTTTYYYQVDDVVIWVDTTSHVVFYKVTKSGYCNTYSDVSKRATFQVALETGSGSGGNNGSVVDSWSSPNLTTYYSGGTIVRYPEVTKAYLALTDGYHNSSPYTPKAIWKEI